MSTNIISWNRAPAGACGVNWTQVAIEATMQSLAPGLTELMCHPGYYDGDLESSPTRLKRERQVEFEIISEARWRARLDELGIVLRGFRDSVPAPLRARSERGSRVATESEGMHVTGHTAKAPLPFGGGSVSR